MDALDEIADLAAECSGSVSNPRYFAEMLAYCLASNDREYQAALAELRDAVARVVAGQRGRTAAL